MSRPMVTYKPSDEVDFVIVGSGAAGGVLAKELSTNGFRVVVLEQGEYLREKDFTHDETKIFIQSLLTNKVNTHPVTFRKSADETARKQQAVVYGSCVGGSSVHFNANFWRFHEIDFKEHSKVGDIPGASFADWPISYADLEPYYTKVEWEVGVSGLAGSSPFDPPRSKPYPMPPLPVKGNGVIFERGCRKLGYHAYPAPMAILSRPRAGRSACMNCGFCLGFGCEVGAKSSTLSSVIPMAEKTGRCEIRTNCYVHRIETDKNGRAIGAVYFDAQQQHPPAKSQGRHSFRQWRRNSAAASALRFQPISRGPREFQRLRRQKSHAQQQRTRLWRFRRATQRLQGAGRQPHHARFLRTRSQARPLWRRRIGCPLRFHAHQLRAKRASSSDTPKWGAGFKQALAHKFHAHDPDFLSRQFAPRGVQQLFPSTPTQRMPGHGDSPLCA